MSSNNHGSPPTYKLFGPSEEDLAYERGTSAALKRIDAERIAADAEATRYLAEMNCPNDLIEWGRAHGIPTFAEVTWCAGFLRGWRLANARAAKE